MLLAGCLGAGVGVVVARRLVPGRYRRDDERARPTWDLTRWLVPALALAWAALAWRLGQAGHLAALPAYLLLATVGSALCWVDLDVHRLPDAIVRPAAAAGVVLLALASLVERELGDLVRAVLAALVLAVLYLLLFLVARGGLGWGDVKLAGLLGLHLGWLGWGTIVVGVLATHLIGGLVALALVVTRRAGRSTAVAFGPYLVLGTLVGVLSSPVHVLTG